MLPDAIVSVKTVFPANPCATGMDRLLLGTFFYIYQPNRTPTIRTASPPVNQAKRPFRGVLFSHPPIYSPIAKVLGLRRMLPFFPPAVLPPASRVAPQPSVPTRKL